jgi:hypothetical protein
MTVEGERSLPLLSRPSLFDRSPRRRRLSSNSGVAAAIEGIGRARVPAGDELAGGFRGLGVRGAPIGCELRAVWSGALVLRCPVGEADNGGTS